MHLKLSLVSPIKTFLPSLHPIVLRMAGRMILLFIGVNMTNEEYIKIVNNKLNDNNSKNIMKNKLMMPTMIDL